MANKPEYVDMIGDATRQMKRSARPVIIEAEVKETSRLSHWPPDSIERWRMETLTPWKLKPWKSGNWG